MKDDDITLAELCVQDEKRQKEEREEVNKLFTSGNIEEIRQVSIKLQEFSEDDYIKQWLLMHDFDPELIDDIWDKVKYE